ncbi:MAG: thioredoxin-disulfide reductase [Lachnospiraceae bacterium]
MDQVYDLVIIGSGPAGLSAAIYAQRAKLNTLVIEKEMVSGGQVLTTYDVDNYPGLPGIGGFDLGMKFRQHADHLEAQFKEDEVQQIVLTALSGIAEEDGQLQAAQVRLPEAEPLKQLVCKSGTYLARTVIVATGAYHRKLGVPGETELTGMGVSYCATCDGAFFKNKVTAVVGGGDVALEDAIFLARMCKQVYLIHRRDELRGAKTLQEKLLSLDNVTVIWNSVVETINGTDQVESLQLKNKKTDETSELAVDGVFIAVGITPNSQTFEGLLDMDSGYIKAAENCQSSVPGIYAAGDVRTKQLRQIVTAVSDGANAVTSVERYLTEA